MADWRIGITPLLNDKICEDRRLTGQPKPDTVSDYWSQADVNESAGIQWVELPQIGRKLNLRATGSPNINWVEYSEEFLGHLPKPRYALSLGCGYGFLERLLVQKGICQRVDGVDVAQGAVDAATRRAREEGIDGLQYWVEDLNNVQFPENKYDVVYAHASLHHVFQLEALYEQIRKTLKPNGVFVSYEYTGPSQMQFPRQHLELADKLIQIIPEKYRFMKRFGTNKVEAPRLRLSDMNQVDPSEGIHAREVVPLMATYFEFKHVRYIGGTLSLLVFNDIAGNFREGDPETDPIIDMIIAFDNLLVDKGVLPSYHAYVVCQKTDVEMIAQQQNPYDSLVTTHLSTPVHAMTVNTVLDNQNQLGRQALHIAQLEGELNMIRNTRAWRLALRWYNLKRALFGR